MTIKVYQGERASHTHENRMLDSFIEAVRSRWEKSEDSLVMISNAYWNQAEIDLVCILQTALVVIDFKAFRGQISVSENGPWMNGNIRIRGGSKQNPLIQIKHNKFSVINWLKDRGLLSHCNLGHVCGAVVFDGPVKIQGDLPANISQWFSTVSIDDAPAYLDRLASPQISISDGDRDLIIDALGAPEYRWSAHQIVDTGTSEDYNGPGLSPTASQLAALEAIERFVSDPAFAVLSIAGMTATGKSSLIPQLNPSRLGERPLIVLAPNNRFAGAMARAQGLKASGLYHHIYDTNATPKEVKSDKGKITQVPLRGDASDPDNCVYLIDDAHLVSDTYFEPEPGKRFGSGRLVTDFLEHARLKSTDRKLIVLSDPYHTTHAKDADLLPAQDLWERYELTGQTFTLDHLVRDDETGAITDNALNLVRHINNHSFTEFDFIQGNGLALKPGKTAAENAAEHIHSSPTDIFLLAYSNAEVSKLNNWARRKRFNAPSKAQVVPGDLLEIHSFVRSGNPLERGALDLSAGDLIVVEEVGELRRISQPLKGRNEPIEFQVQDIRPSGGSIFFPLLVDFLLAESKEIPAEVWIGSQVWSRAEKVQEPVKARFGYAATAHHARATRRLRSVVAPPMSIGRHNEAYFRWLYTAITRATHSCVVANWRPLSVFDGANFNESAASQKKSLPIGAGLHFDPERPLTADEKAWAVPDGLPSESEPLKNTVAIWLAIQPTLDTCGYEVVRIQHHPYQVQFTLRDSKGRDSELRVSYKSNKTISSIRTNHSENWLQICEGISSRIAIDANETRIVKALQKLPNLGDLRVLSIKCSNYRIQVAIGNTADGLAELELNYTGEGLVSSVRLLQYTEKAIRDRIVSAFRDQNGH